MSFDHTNPDNYIDGKPGVCDCGKEDHEIMCTIYFGLKFASDSYYKKILTPKARRPFSPAIAGEILHEVIFGNKTEDCDPPCSNDCDASCMTKGCSRVKRWTDADMITFAKQFCNESHLLDELKEFRDDNR